MADQRNRFDAKRYPLVASTLEPAPTKEVAGEYDESTETWSHRDIADATPKKNNEEA